MSNTIKSQDETYLNLLLSRLNVCKAYKPKFGQGKEVSYDDFQILYGSEPFYSWFGLNNPLVYAAHKAAGGITSLYRQIGIGCEELFRQIIIDQFGLSATQATWSYQIKTPGRRVRRFSLDGRIELHDLNSDKHKQIIREWMDGATSAMGTDPAIAAALKGVVFEIRQGYKSKDSKRQNADIANAGMAYSQGYLPVIVILSRQIDRDIANRYADAGWLLLQGSLNDSPISSTYAFCEQVLGYDLAGFFSRNARLLRQTVEEVLKTLLSPHSREKKTTIYPHFDDKKTFLTNKLEVTEIPNTNNEQDNEN